jgi:nucleotide-binding universal stress UspA family protein
MASPSVSERPIRKILLATDFSPTARAALGWATGLARRHGARIHMVHAVETFAVPMNVSLEAQTLVTESVEHHLGELERIVGQAGVEVSAAYETGRPWEVIAESEQQWQPDLLVIGARGRTAYANIVLGSTADRVIRTAIGPVLTVHPRDAEPPAGAGTILVATDFSEEASLATSTAVRLLGRQDQPCRLVLLHVCPAPVVYEAEAVATVIAQQMADEEELARQRLETLSAPLRGESLSVEIVVRQGQPAMIVQEEARAAEADLIALGTHGRSGVRHLLLGSIAERVVHHAHCPVLTVRQPDAERPVEVGD